MTRVGQYELEREIGRGGMGVVYRAVDTALDRPVAVKMMQYPASVSDDERESIRARFEREAKAAAKIKSGHVVQILSFGRADDGELYLAMELLDGASLEETLRLERRLSLGRAVKVAQQLCRGLKAAHELGIVHRDVKAANVMLTKSDDGGEHVKLLDFGVAHLMTSPARPGALVGTVQAMAPEQLSGAAIDARVDVYAVGALLYRMLTGAPPFLSSTPAALLDEMKTTRPTRAGQRTAVPAGLDALVLGCLSLDPAARPSSAAELDRLLGAAVSKVPVTRADDVTRTVQEKKSGVGLAVAVIGAALAAIAAIIAALLR
ncbi:MAG TPA: serine/threonine-protein kinase [Myxococcota bacterium]